MLAGTLHDQLQDLAPLTGITLAEVPEKIGRDVIIERPAAPDAHTPTLAEAMARTARLHQRRVPIPGQRHHRRDEPLRRRCQEYCLPSAGSELPV